MAGRGAGSVITVGVAGFVAGVALMWSLGSSRSPLTAHHSPTTHGEWIYLRKASGDSLHAYVAYPERKDKAPAVIVIHEIFGLTNWEPTVVDRLAGAGYVAIVPDLLSSRFGITPPDPDSGRKLTELLDADSVNADLDVAFAYLNSLPAVRKDQVGTIGFCWGGGRSFRYATVNPKLKAAVVCYGPAPDSSAMQAIRAGMLGVYGEADARINASLPDVDRQLKQAGVKFRYRIYPGTGHGFLKPGRKGSDTEQVERAWGEILGFYREMLGR